MKRAPFYFFATLRNLREKAEKKKEAKKTKEKAELAKTAAFFKRQGDAHKLINDESNRLITWSLSTIGGTILTMISTSYVQPKGWILYCYTLFAFGWTCLGASVYFGEKLSRIYISQVILTVDDITNVEQKEINRFEEQLQVVGSKIHKSFYYQLRWFQAGMLIFCLWLALFLIWFIAFRKP